MKRVPKSELVAIGERIIAARERKDIRQVDLARMTGLRTVTVYRHESGQAKPNLATALKYAKHLDVTVEWLLGETVVSSPRPPFVDKPLKIAPTKGSTDVPLPVAELLAKGIIAGVNNEEIAHLARLARAERELTPEALELLLLSRRVSQTHDEDDIAAYTAAARRQGIEAGGREVDLTPKSPPPPSPDRPRKARRR